MLFIRLPFLNAVYEFIGKIPIKCYTAIRTQCSLSVHFSIIQLTIQHAFRDEKVPKNILSFHR